MDIPINTQVFCNGNLCGRSICVIVDPAKKSVTHVAVKIRHQPRQVKLVPVDFIESATPYSIYLRCNPKDLLRFDDFLAHEFVTVKEPLFSYAPDEFLLWPEPYLQQKGQVEVQRERLPLGELPIHRGARVKCTDGLIGRVDEFLMDPSNDHITHIVLQEGHLWGKKRVDIPVSQIDHIDKDIVYLKLDKSEINHRDVLSVH
jgi:sporulation protein YlmC with PRC-barrel domain